MFYKGKQMIPDGSSFSYLKSNKNRCLRLQAVAQNENGQENDFTKVRMGRAK